jgi:hypothetical protein
LQFAKIVSKENVKKLLFLLATLMKKLKKEKVTIG